MPFRRRRPILAVMLLLLAGAAGLTAYVLYEPPPPPSPGPRAVLEELIAARASGDQAAIAARVHPDQSAGLVRVVLAVDELLAANTRLMELVRSRIGPGLAASIDQGHLADYLDILSRHVELLDERISGDEATVAFVVSGRLPTRRARLVRLDGQWRYDPGEDHPPALPAALREMARGLRQVCTALESGQLDPAAVRERPELLLEEVRRRLKPGVEMLPPPPSP
jgi:hypothetical protein